MIAIKADTMDEAMVKTQPNDTAIYIICKGGSGNLGSLSNLLYIAGAGVLLHVAKEID